MKWKNRKPSRPGWYWLDHPFHGIHPVHLFLYVSQGYDHEKGAAFMMVSEQGPSRYLKERYFAGCRWAGPMKPPREER